MKFLAALMMVFLVSACSAGAENSGANETKKDIKRYIYEWTDTKGNVHITDDLGGVPDRYRAKARKIEMPKGQEAGPQETTGPASEGAPEKREAEEKAAWQKRIRDWKERLAKAEARYRELDQKRLDTLGKWGGPASGHLEGRVEADKIQKQMDEVQVEINEARSMIDTVIPEEARRAGIPPGWLRE